MSAPIAEAPIDTDILSTQVVELIPSEGIDSGMRAHYIKQLERIGNTASETKLASIQDLCLVFQSLLQELEDQSSEISDEESSLLLEWPALLMSYIESPADPLVRSTIIEFLRNPCWLRPLDDDYANALSQMLEPQPLHASTPNIDHTELSKADPDISSAASEKALNSPAIATTTAESTTQTASPQSTQSLSSEQQELIDLLSVELKEMLESEAQALNGLSCEEANPDSHRAVFESLAEQVERIGSAADMVGLAGLHRASQLIHANLRIMSESADTNLARKTEKLLNNWPRCMLVYLQNLQDLNSCTSLVNCLQALDWPKPLSDTDAPVLIELLARATVVAEDENSEPRQTNARPDDVSLEIPDDVNKELLEGLLQELPSHTTGFSKAIIRAIEGEFLSDIDVAQRIAHTLKGAGNVVGVRGITNLTHHLEDILEALSKHNALPPPALAETLVSAADCLEGMSDALLGLDTAPEDALEVLQDVLDWINRIANDGIPAQDAGENSVTKSPRPEPKDSSSSTASEIKPGQQESGSSDAGGVSPEVMLRIPAALAEELLRLAGESMISNVQIQEQLRRSIEQSESLNRQNLLLQQLGFDLEQLVDMRSLWSPQRVRTNDSEFDSLELNQYNELHTFTHRLVEAVTDSMELTQALSAQLTVLNGIALGQGRLNSENQEAVMRTRMVPVNTVVARLQRSLRQACRMTGKQSNLNIIGAETLVDTQVLNDLMNPIMHLLRNAVDHGIESSEQRSQAGKPPPGNIKLAFSRKGDHILVSCQDDGSGLDYATIQQKAEERGLLAPSTSPSKQELNQILLTHGFSTRDQVTQVSGRGVGMDAVHECIKDMKGTLSIDSEHGQGTTIELSIPVTLLATHAIFVRLGKHIVAVANRGVDELLSSDAGSFKEMGSGLAYQLGDAVYECEYLDNMLDMDHERRNGPRGPYSVLLVNRDDGAKRAVLVQEILDTRDVVVKPLGRYAPKPEGVIGATILGDGGVAPVLDLTELLGATSAAPSRDHLESKARDARHHLPLALVVDDSLSARRSLAQFVQDIGYRVRTAKDGMEAVDAIEHQVPDIMLVDLEMPRMNGLELTSHVRTNEKTRDIPVIMVTSRSTEKHRQQANKAGVNLYMTKPFAEDELANNIEACLEHA